MADLRTDQMALIAFMQAGSTSVYAGSWRHPATEHRYLDASYYAKIGRQLEEGCFDLMFFDDRLAMPGVYGGSVAEAVSCGARPVKLDLGVVLGVLAQATSRIGLGATYSTTYYAPFHVARTFASLDHLSGGRGGRCDSAQPSLRPLRRPGQGARAGTRRPVLLCARALDGAAHPTGPTGHHPGRFVGTRT